MTMDAARRAVLLLDTDPRIAAIPVVGVYVFL